VHRGAFHEVLVLRTQVVARLSLHRGRISRLLEEHQALTSVVSLQPRWRIPRALSPVRTSPDGWAGMLTDHVPGCHRLDATWPQAAEEITALLRAVESGTLLTAAGKLPPPRAWCGGSDFPQWVTERLLPLLPDEVVREAAHDAVQAMLEAEQTAGIGIVHGDLGLHNIFWEADACQGERASLGRITALIDVDHAAAGDPAIDVAPLIGQFGAQAVAEVVAPATLRRAMLHRATLSLQVAAGAELAGDSKLRDFALENFTTRLAAGTLHDPAGARPAF
jgi:hypothetical protein